MLDLAIVGAGPAGLALAYYLRDLDLDVRLLEAGDDVGGRTRSAELAGAPVNTGAMFVYRGTRAEELAVELGLRTRPFEPTTYGIHYGGTTAVSPTDADLVAALPLSEASRAALLGFMDEIRAEYKANVSGGEITDDADRLASQTVAERLVGLPHDVVQIIEAAVRGGSVGASSQLSAKYALRYLGSYIARERNNRLYPVDGMQELPRALASRLGARTRISTGTVVQRIEQRDGHVEVDTVTADGRHEVVRARHVAVAVPAPLVEGLCPGLPARKTEALRGAATPGSSTLTIAVDVTGLPEYADWAFVSTVDTAFDAIINPTPGAADDGIVRFTCYGNSAGFIPEFGEDEESVAPWIEDFLTVAPGLRGRILGYAAQTWEHCFSVLSPVRAQLLPDLRRPAGALHFAGDYTSATAGSHGAYDEGHRVAEELRGIFGGDAATGGEPRPTEAVAS